MNAQESARLVREVALSGNCSHPIRLRGELLNLATGEVKDSTLRVACKDRRKALCPSCSYLYQADAWILASSGLAGGKGVPESVDRHPRLFATLTAPSFGRVHTIKPDGTCVTRGPDHEVRESRCRHGMLLRCSITHSVDDPLLGSPLCVGCFDYVGAVLWNAHVSLLWNNTIQLTRRVLAESGGIRQTNLKSVAQLQYFKVAEMQRRGLVHLHCLLRVDGADGHSTPPPLWLTSEVLIEAVRRSIVRAKAFRRDGREITWGPVFDVRDLTIDSEEVRKVASYVAKYSTKTTDGTHELARRFHSRRQIETLVNSTHLRTMALAAWDLAERPQFQGLNLRSHAHALGFTGQLITKSRTFSTTFSNLRGARATFMKRHNVGDPIEGTFSYDGRGYDDPRAAQLAELFFTMQRQLREEALQARLALDGGS